MTLWCFFNSACGGFVVEFPYAGVRTSFFFWIVYSKVNCHAIFQFSISFYTLGRTSVYHWLLVYLIRGVTVTGCATTIVVRGSNYSMINKVEIHEQLQKDWNQVSFLYPKTLTFALTFYLCNADADADAGGIAIACRLAKNDATLLFKFQRVSFCTRSEINIIVKWFTFPTPVPYHFTSSSGGGESVLGLCLTKDNISHVPR